MKTLLISILSLFYTAANAQNFGCFDIPADIRSGYESDNSFLYHYDWNFSILTDVNWDLYEPNRCMEGWQQYFFEKDEYKTSYLKMAGRLSSGKREGVWTFYNIDSFIEPGICFSGQFVHDRKEGLWIGYFKTNDGDSIAQFEVPFKNDLPHGEVKEYYQNGHLCRSAIYEDGKLNGEQIMYYYNDTLEKNEVLEKAFYFQGQPEGERIAYSETGEIVEREVFSNGLRDGNCYYNRWNTITEIQFSKGELHGIFKIIDSNGNVVYELECRNNKPYTVICAHDNNGNALNAGTLKNGNGTLIQYTRDGVVKSKIYYQNQLISGEMLNYQSNGRDTLEHGFLFTDSLPTFKTYNGFQNAFDINIAFAWAQNFKYGTHYKVFYPDGKTQKLISSIPGDTLLITDYYENGQVMKTSKEFHGLKSGTETTYHEDGQLRSSGKFEIVEVDCKYQSLKNGLFRYYHPNGALQAEVYYVNGIETGKSYFYDDGGNLRRVNVPVENGRSYSVFDGDTVNMTDACSLKQGKWIEFPRSFSGACSTLPPDEKYYKDGVPYGYWKTIFRFINHRTYWISPDSAWVWYYSADGFVSAEGLMVEGKKSGEWKIYEWEKGCLEATGNYCNDRREGVWLYYRRNGHVKQEKIFHFGEEIIGKKRDSH